MKKFGLVVVGIAIMIALAACGGRNAGNDVEEAYGSHRIQIPVFEVSGQLQNLEEFWGQYNELSFERGQLLGGWEPIEIESISDELLSDFIELQAHFNVLRELTGTLPEELYEEIYWFLHHGWWEDPITVVTEEDPGRFSFIDGTFRIREGHFVWVEWAENVSIDPNNEAEQFFRHYRYYSVIDAELPAYLIIRGAESGRQLFVLN
ncbi:MAG: hypothetical protein FWC79_01830 [Oscillospiraceae bacterium]|nr:hypothetical protein [Oscillospiraceae bacterium]